MNSNAQRGNSGASRLGDDYLLYYLDGSTQKYINGDYFTIEDGTDELTVYVEPLDNTVYESNETITITLSDSDEYDLDTTIELGNGELTTGEWHSFALVFNSGSVTAYIDGTEYTGSVSGTQLDEADGSPLTLGKS